MKKLKVCLLYTKWRKIFHRGEKNQFNWRSRLIVATSNISEAGRCSIAFLCILSGHHAFLRGLCDVNTDEVACFVVAYKCKVIKGSAVIGVARYTCRWLRKQYRQQMKGKDQHARDDICLKCAHNWSLSVITLRDRRREKETGMGPLLARVYKNKNADGHSSHLGGFDFVASAAGPASQVREDLTLLSVHTRLHLAPPLLSYNGGWSSRWRFTGKERQQVTKCTFWRSYLKF